MIIKLLAVWMIDILYPFIVISIVIILGLYTLYSSKIRVSQQSVNAKSGSVNTTASSGNSKQPSMTIQSLQAIKSLAIKENLFNSINWSSININNISHTSRQVLLDEKELTDDCHDAMKDGKSSMIPIKTRESVEYVEFVNIKSLNAFIGVGIKESVTKPFIEVFARIFTNRSIPSVIIDMIMEHCIILNISQIYLDPQYIYNQHQLLIQSQKDRNVMDISIFIKPFLSNLRITRLYDYLEDDDLLGVPSDWSDDDETQG